MSDAENTKGKARGGSSWSEHEVLVYILSAIEYTGAKIDFANAPAPAGRNANGCVQKMFKVKNALRAEIDAVKNGESIEGVVEATPKKGAATRKRKVVADEDGEGTPKKRGRAKKNAIAEPESEVRIKNEPEGEMDIEDEA